MPAGSAFCPGCGASQHLPAPRSSVPAGIIAALLLLMPPIGLILMWTSSAWDDDVKWAISGIFFPPLWLRFLWKISWLPAAVMALIALALTDAVVQGGMSVVGAIAIVAMVAMILLLIRPSQRKAQSVEGSGVSLRHLVEGKLAACDDVIADL
ncbi:MAG: hypothetical protein ACR2JC_09805 [Chloroflexota bacterium]